VDEGEWQELQEGEMPWSLHAGENALEVCAVNVFGKEGRKARAEVRYA
jgi:hypothetical protein